MRSNILVFQGDFRFGGAEVVGVNLANAYCELGYTVTLIVLKRRGGLEERILSGVTILDLNTRLLFSFTKLRRLFAGISDKTIIISTIRNLNVAVFLTANRNKNLKLVFREANTYQQLWSFKLKKLFKYLVYKLIIPLVYRQADLIVANSTDTRRDVDRFNFLNLDLNIHVVGNPVLTSKMASISSKKNTHTAANTELVEILSVGRLHEQKDYFLALTAFAMFKKDSPNSMYTILGEGLLRGDIIAYAESLGLKYGVDWRIEEPVPDPGRFYARCDLFLMTSLWEGFGNVIVEAMGYGKTPVIANCPGGPKDIIGNEHGYYLTDRSVESIFKGIKEAVDKPIDPDVLKKRANDFSAATIAIEYLSLLEEDY